LLITFGLTFVHYEISVTKNAPCLSKNLSNQQTERNKLINWMKIASIPQLSHPFIMDMPKKLLDKRSGILQRPEIKIKMSERNQTNTHTYPDYQLPTEGKQERVGERFFSEWIRSAGPKLKMRLIYLSPILVETSRRAMPNKDGRWKGYVNIRVILQPSYRQGWLKVKAIPCSFSSWWLTMTDLFVSVSSLLLRREFKCQYCRWTVRCPEVYCKSMTTKYWRDEQVGRHRGAGLWHVSSPV
jgi:hypothetical protein